MQLFDGVTDLGLVKDGGAQPPNIEAGQCGDGQILSRVRLSGRTYITALPLSLTRDNLPHPQPSQQHHRRHAELLHEQAPEP